MTEKKQKRWFLGTLAGIITILLLILAVMLVVDPYFHYHKPVEGMSYRLYSERYINDGIARNFEYDAIITGTSMNQNFKTSQMDELFGTNSVKMTFAGGAFQEISQNLETALSSDNDVKTVLWGIDYLGLNRDYDFRYYEEYPEYLYDNNLLNDVSYIFNKTILFEGLANTLVMNLKGEPSTTFDEYATWDSERGWGIVSKYYQRTPEILPMEKITEEDIGRVTKNMEENIVKLVNKYPDTEFILFYTPYSILYWESLYREGWLEIQLEVERIASEMLLECENVKLYSYFHKTDIMNNIDNFRDKEHYMPEINDMIMQWLANDEGRITKDNYMDIIAWEREYYTNYDYDSLHEKLEAESSS